MKKLIWLLVVGVLVLTAARPALADTLYVVQPGDTLYRIATRFGVTVQAIVAANNLYNPNLIYSGQLLNIPGPGGEAPPATPGVQRYVVQGGDTLWRIAQRFSTSVQALMAANNLRDSRIYTGQVLIIPGAVPAATPTPSDTRPPITTTPPPAATPCGYSWYFANPPAGACPAAEPIEVLGAAERFERGLMIWLSEVDIFYVLHDRPQPQQASRLTFVAGPLQIKPGGSVDNRVGGVPAGLWEPVSGFGLLWRGETVQYPPGLRADLGWATEAEHSFEAALQCEAYPGTSFGSPSCFLRGPTGRILHIYYLRYFGNYWEAWP